ncbi:MAG: hypothetical protein KC433_08625, partial [Anaerolineales bacterium]|nr:hypothetical protein [Anaerolineales bacterium]
MKSRKWVWPVVGWGVALLVLWLVVRTVPLREVGRTLALLRGWQLAVLVLL